MPHIETLKPWQIEAIQLGRPAKHFLSQAPGGSGKSLLQVMLAQADIEDTGNKQLILVPKNHIHHGFFDKECIEFVLPGETKASRWMLCGEMLRQCRKFHQQLGGEHLVLLAVQDTTNRRGVQLQRKTVAKAP